MFVTAALLALSFLPQTPDPTLPPAGVKSAIVVEGRGVQIYTCAVQDGSFAWVFQAPEAILLDPSTRQQLGTHSAGPTWTWNDGSAIEGKLLQKHPSSESRNIPWLLLATHPAGSTTGVLSDVILVRRSDTEAGSAPQTGCDAQHQGITLRVPYKATYTFYKKAP